MMSEEHSENGRINREGEEVIEDNGVEDDIPLNLDPSGDSRASPKPPSPGINSPRHHLSPALKPDGAANQEPEMEFFDQKRLESDGEGADGDNVSPSQRRDRDSDSYHSRGFAMISPPQSPAVGLSTASAHMLEEEESPRQQQNLTMEDSDEVVKSKPDHAHRDNPRDSPPRVGSKKSAALARLTTLKDRSEDLEVEILTREKVEEKESYIRYKLHVKSSRYERSEYTVWRRYKDFEWLRDITVKSYPTLIVPPLPGKQLARYFDQKSEGFLEERQHALCRFLQRMCFHPYFSFDKHLKVFLTAEPEQFNSYVAEMTGANRILGAVTSSVKFAANSFRLKDPDPEFMKAAKYFEDLNNKLGVVERVATRIHTETDELAADVEDFGAAIKQWSLNESELVSPIQQMGTCLDNCSMALRQLNEADAYSLLMTAKEYQLYCSAGVSAVRHRDSFQLERDKMSEDRDKKKKMHDDAASTGKLQKLPKLADDLQKVGVEAERSLDELSVANEKLRVDIEKWTDAKDRELRDMMTHWAGNHVNYHNKCYSEWEKVLRMLRMPGLSAGASPTNQNRDYYNSVVPGGVVSADEPPQSRTSRRAAKEESPDLFQ